MTALTRHVADFIETASLAEEKSALYDKAEKVIADTFAAILSGAGSEVAPPILRYLRGAGNVGDRPVLGTHVTTSAEAAALLNGTFGAALDFDDVLSMMPGHPSAVVVSALCAMMPDEPISGARFIDAYVIGIEVGAKIATGIGFEHYRRGFHATGTLCVFSALAAVSRLRRLPADTITTAFGLAASMASGLQINFGTMTKPLHSGLAARASIASCNLAEAGFTASKSVLEGKAGFFATYGTAESDLGRTIATLGKPWAVLNPSMTTKKYSCCVATHRAIDGLQKINEALGLSPETLGKVTCRVPPGALTPLPYNRPQTGLESKFSMPYALAAGIVERDYSIWTFTDEAVARPAISAVLPRIEVLEDAACIVPDESNYQNISYGSRGKVMVEAVTTNGRSASAEVRFAPGHPARELSWQDISNKFADCARYAGLTDEQSSRAFAKLRSMGAEERLEDLLVLLRSSEGPNMTHQSA